MQAPDVEFLPLPALAALSQRTLHARQVLKRAARSALYRRAWGERLKEIPALVDYAGLRTIPFVDGRSLRSVQIETDPADWPACEHVRFWLSTSGTTGAPKWIPISDADLQDAEQYGRRILEVPGLFRDGDNCLEINAEAPSYSDSFSAMGVLLCLQDGRRLERTIVSFTEMAKSLTFALGQRPKGLGAFPSLAMALGEKIVASAPLVVRHALKGRPLLAAPIAFAFEHLIRARPRYFFAFRWGIFGGEPLAPYRSALRASWGMESCETYGLSEVRSLFCECTAHDGVHIWLDLCLPEIIPQAELDRARDDPSAVPAALPLWEADPGLVGELVLTTFADALPLIRYRTSDLVEVVGVTRCRCGRTHPRIRVLHRADDIVNLGIIRFSLLKVAELLDQVCRHGRVEDWQLRVTRAGYKPRLVVIVQGSQVDDDRAFVAEIRGALAQLRALEEGLKNDVVVEPEIRLVAGLAKERTGTGKLRRLFYEREAATEPTRQG